MPENGEVMPSIAVNDPRHPDFPAGDVEPDTSASDTTAEERTTETTDARPKARGTGPDAETR